MGTVREASTLMELDRDERKLEVFLSFHRSTLTAADLKIFLPFTINLDPYIKKVIKEEQLQSSVEEDVGPGGAAPWGAPQHPRHPHSKLFHRKHRLSPPSQTSAPVGISPQQMWVGWANTPYMQSMPQSMQQSMQQPMQQYAPQFAPQYAPQFPASAQNPINMLRTAFPGLGDVSGLRLSTLSVERVCALARAALGAGGEAAAGALQRHRVCGLALAACRLQDLEPILELPFGDWELFKLLIINLRELEASLPTATTVNVVISEKNVETETDAVKPRPVIERSRPSNVEKQVTLEEQMICGALQTLSEEAMEDVLQNDAAPDEESELPPAREPPILKSAGSFRSRRALADPPAVTFNVENEQDSDDGQITFSARPRPSAHYRAPAPAPAPPAPVDEPRRTRSRPSSLLVTDEGDAPDRLTARSRSVEDSTRTGSPVVDLKLRNLRRTVDILRKVNSAERLSRLKDKIMSRGGGSRERSPVRSAGGSDDESAPLVSPGGGPTRPLGVECEREREAAASADLSPRSDLTELDSPRPATGTPDFDLLPADKGTGGGGRESPRRTPRLDSASSLSNMVEPYNMRLLAHGMSESRALWRQDALDSGPPWPWDDPDSAV